MSTSNASLSVPFGCAIARARYHSGFWDHPSTTTAYDTTKGISTWSHKSTLQKIPWNRYNWNLQDFPRNMKREISLTRRFASFWAHPITTAKDTTEGIFTCFPANVTLKHVYRKIWVNSVQIFMFIIETDNNSLSKTNIFSLFVHFVDSSHWYTMENLTHLLMPEEVSAYSSCLSFRKIIWR